MCFTRLSFLSTLFIIQITVFGQTTDKLEAEYNFEEVMVSLTKEGDEEVSRILDSARQINDSLGLRSEAYANNVGKLIQVLVRRSDYHKSVTVQSAYIELFEEEEKVTNAYATAAFYMAYASKFIDDHESEVKYYNETISIFGEKHPFFATFKNNLGLAHQHLGNYETALSNLLVAIQETKDRTTSGFAKRLMNLAYCYESLGDYAKAEQYYNKSLMIWDNLDKDNDEYGKLLNNIGKLYRQTRDYEKAKQLFKNALDNFLENFDETHDRYGYILNDYASILLVSGEEEEAIRLMEKNLKIAEENDITNTVDYYERQFHLARAYNMVDRFNEALPLLTSATSNIEKFYGRDHPDYGNLLKGLADTYFGMGRTEEAVNAMTASNRILIDQIEQVFKFRSETEKKAFMTKLSSNFDDLQSIPTNLSPDSDKLNELNLNNQLLLKGLLLKNSKGVLKELASLQDKDIRDNINMYRSMKNDLIKNLSLPILDRRIDVDSLREEINSKEVELVKIHSQNFQVKNNLLKDWKDSRSKLNAHEYAIEFAHFNQTIKGRSTGKVMYVAYLYSAKSDNPKFIPLFEEAELKNLIFKQSKNQLYGSRELYDIVWRPLAKEINENSRVYFAPSGLLNQISFAAIYDGSSALVRNYDLVQLNSTHSLTEDNSAPILEHTMLIGGIEYDYNKTNDQELQPEIESYAYFNSDAIANSRGTKTRGESWTYLKGTLNEINDIKEKLEQTSASVSILSSYDATEKELKKLSGNSPQLLHIATHGFFYENQNMDTSFSIDLSTEDRYRLAEDPLMRSGLIMAGANYAWKNSSNPPNEIEDGILTAMEISNLDLSNTDLVVLSACETGLGDIEGSEGVYGLQRAFKMAGVNKMIMSLWQVPDEETAEFMQLFYEKWLNERTVRDAFIETQRAMYIKYKNEPLKWAAFVLLE